MDEWNNDETTARNPQDDERAYDMRSMKSSCKATTQGYVTLLTYIDALNCATHLKDYKYVATPPSYSSRSPRPTMAPNFTLSIHSVTLPNVPEQPPDLEPSDIRSPISASALSATSSLRITLSLPLAKPKDPIYPATRLQLSYKHQGTGEIFIPESITRERLVWVEDQLFELEVPPKDIPRAKVNHEQSTTAEVLLYAWKGEKLLGKWSVCEIEGLGIEGLKSDGVPRVRYETWMKARGV